ncbi:putative polyketide synthase [Metarhizium anisopliae]|nr:putative polyketide synthase [Metarhizium anisopliae]
MFSSIAAAAGNRGQSKYSAANMFMVATAMERRRQGLAASVLHLGAVLGVGYIMREFDETVLPTILRGGFMWMEERGFHQCIAEAILAGRPQAGRNPEIITGLRMINADDAEPVPWIRNPRLQHYINWGGDGNLKKTMQNAAVPVRARLFEARNLEETSKIIQGKYFAETFSNQLDANYILIHIRWLYQTTFNITFSIKIKGELNEDKLEAAVKVLGRRHETLRTAFITEGDQNLQCVLKNSLLCLEKKAIRDISQVTREFEDLRDHIYDIQHGETMWILLLSLSSEQSFLIIGYHHINMDGASLEVFLADLEKAYTGKPLAPNPLQYPDFSLRQSLERKEGKHSRELDFWKAKLGGCPTSLPILPWSLTKSREPIRRYEHTKVTRYIEADLSSRINHMCRKQRASIFHFYLAVFEVMLYRLLDAPDTCIGMADANRFEGNLSGSIGMYLNLIPLVAHLKPSQSFRDVLKETRRNAYEAMAHSKLPFDALLDDLKVNRSIFHSPLFQAFINYRAGVSENRNFGRLAAEAGETVAGRTAYDICLDMYDNPGASTRIDIVVQKKLYSVEDATILTDSYFHLMNYFSANPYASLSEPTLGLNESIYDDDLLGIGYVMLKHGNDVWNYRQMAVRVNSIASALINLELSPKSIIGVFQEAGPDWICSMLAILRVGATYIPLDSSTPVPRLAIMVNDCQPVVVIVDEATFHQTTGLNLRQEALIISTADISESGGNKVPVKAKSEDAAVILYTSGTTGTPKGVVLSHNGLRNYLEWEKMSGQEIVLQHSALGFDLGLWQSLVTLVYGGSIVIVPRPLRGDSVAITKLVAQEKITYVGATPSEYLGWIQYGFSNLSQSTSWKYAMSCGELCPSKLIEDFGKLGLPDLHLWNSYGPSEATMGSNAEEIPLGEGVADRILAGPALVNRAVHIVDEDLKPLPRGATGETCISGAGVAMGYVNNDLLTRQAFVTNPVPPAVFEKNGWTRMYRTGDKGRILERGSLEVLGRVNGDSQVKIRGVRIELQDIESTIVRVSNGALANAAVTPRGDAPILVAHAVFAKGVEVEDQTQFLQRLAASLPLPRYMHPAIIIPIKDLPLTSNGKLDWTAVEKLQVSNGTERATGAAKLGNVERQLREAWEEVISEEVLQHYTIDRGSNFFHVGGNSLLLINLQHLIKTRFGVALPVATLFEQSTLRAMAGIIIGTTYLEAVETDWTEETALTKHVVDAGPFIPAVTKSTRGVIIMTGATGFLGLELLNELVESPSVTKVHCIAVRSQSKLDLFLGLPKVTLHQGDLSAPRAGLSVQVAEAIFGEADAIVHSGADVSFLKTYQTLRPANVEATKELARLALVHNVPFHYISTTATGRLNNIDTLYEISLAENMPPLGYSDGYVAGKWASEVFLEKVHERLGLPVCIHRPSSITGPAASDLDVVNSIIKFSPQLKAVPTSSRWRGDSTSSVWRMRPKS